ncbi:spore germination protein [Bacillota bacterium LX-D]|nr:spore germination protein [Bacillota bacterium LX-D]
MGVFKSFWGSKKKPNAKESSSNSDNSWLPQNLSNDLSRNIEMIKKAMGYASDILVREFTIASNIETKAAVIAIKGLTKNDLINEQVLGSLMLDAKFKNTKKAKDLFEQIKQYSMPNLYVKEEVNVGNTVSELISGNSILFLDGINKALIAGSQGWKERQVSQPITENVVRGPRDGFTENIESNVALIRRRIKSPDLRVESFKTGTRTKTDLYIVYLNGVVKNEVVDEVKNRLKRIEIDGVLESGYIEELIEDNPFSPFPQMEHSERPDKVSAAILEGRVAILVDTTPFVLMVPTVFFQFLQSADDYYERYLIGSLTRVVRIVAYFISVVLPALYIALTSFHQEMIPTPLALSLAASREGVPFPSIGEALIMEAIFEILREASLRLPQQTGQAVSIVGGLVIGQAAVQAGIVSQVMVIIVALTGISSFAIPAFNAAASGRLLRFPLMLLASILGLAGILLGLSIILIHLSSLRSFGVSYLDPFVSSNSNTLNDTVVRNPWWLMHHLPGIISRKRMLRMRPGMKPGPRASSRKKQ